MDANTNFNHTYTLQELLNSCIFIVPEYQRDYAQGRSNPRDEHVLNMFVKEIVDALIKGNHLHLDYVYGNIEQHNNISFFYPVDGQQRLTTLFLFYVYCYQTAEKREKEFLKRFRYDIRSTSNELINLLIDYEQAQDPLSPDWHNWIDIFNKISGDPTAGALLKTYRIIESKLNFMVGIERDNIRKKLNNITFEVVDTKGHELPQNIFWKMNARGRSLTPSEIFKASYLSSDSASMGNSPANNFDGFAESLFDVITVENKDQVFEKIIMYIVNIIFEGIQKIKKDKVSSFDFFSAEYISQDEYLKYNTTENRATILGIFDKLNIVGAKNIFDSFHCLPKYVKEYAIEKGYNGTLDFLLDYSKHDQKLTALFFSYLIVVPIENKEYFEDWLRVCANLIWNSSNVAYALKWIYSLRKKASNIIKFLASKEENIFLLSPDEDSDNVSTRRQYKEEVKKANAILKEKVTRADIIEAENTAFADGRIDFLYIGGWESFKKYTENFNKWFGKDGVIACYKQDIVTAYIKLSPWDWEEAYFNTSKEHWKNIIFGRINNKDYGDGYRHIVRNLLSANDLDKDIVMTDLESVKDHTPSSKAVRESLIKNSWFIKWMIKSNNGDFKIKWKGYQPYFQEGNKRKYILFDAGIWTYPSNENIKYNRQLTEFFDLMEKHGVTIDNDNRIFINDEGDTVSSSQKHMVIIIKIWKGHGYIKFSYRANEYFLGAEGVIFTKKEFDDDGNTFNWNKAEERCIYITQQNNWWAGCLKDEDELINLLNNLPVDKNTTCLSNLKCI